jgi:transposase
MDMWPAYIGGFGEAFEGAVGVFDRFHVIKLVNATVDAIRRAEVKENALLKQTRYLRLKNPQNLSKKQRDRLEPLKAMNLATATAYQMKLTLQELWEQPDRQSAGVFLERWCEWVEGSEIDRAMKKAAQTIRGHAGGILNYFTAPITNGLMEGINSLIQAAKSKARGYRTHRNFCTIIYLVAGKLRSPLPT